METLRVELRERSYPILIGAGLLREPDRIREHVDARDVLIVSNSTVAPLYAGPITAALPSHRVVEAILPDGEAHKTLATVTRLLDVLVANRFGRDCLIIALGGGVVGDMAGFAAACYQRGVRYLQVPTTLLAQVDSAVGGKTGVNHPGGKNLIGAFHQPVAVLADMTTLATLPPRELRAGVAEIIKYGLISDAAFFRWLEAHLDALLALDAAVLAQAVRQSCEIKAKIVAADEREQGTRALLNLGHTFGHAIEAATQYTQWLHGEAVAAGLLMAAAMSRECGMLGSQDVDRLCRVLERAGLPIRIPDLQPAAVLEHMALDKKAQGGRVRLVLLKEIGEAFVTADYPVPGLLRTLDAFVG
ncbi:MAG TPA: 3-dehydroquinate synthase [Steroidobacteraceae bacterium]|nr:3-dehydroquinate synthase [Steroidobacteraceae bacterium]